MHDHGDQQRDEASGVYELRRVQDGLPGPETAHRVGEMPAPACALPFERLRVEARDEALDCVMYAAAEYAALIGYRPMPVIDWLARHGFAVSILPALRERDRIGRKRYGVPLMIEAGRATRDPDVLAGAVARYEAAVELAKLFCAEGSLAGALRGATWGLALASTIAREKLDAYLRANGWKIEERWPPAAGYTKPGVETVVYVGVGEKRADEAACLFEALVALEAVEGRPINEIVADVLGDAPQAVEGDPLGPVTDAEWRAFADKMCNDGYEFEGDHKDRHAFNELLAARHQRHLAALPADAGKLIAELRQRLEDASVGESIAGAQWALRFIKNRKPKEGFATVGFTWPSGNTVELAWFVAGNAVGDANLVVALVNNAHALLTLAERGAQSEAMQATLDRQTVELQRLADCAHAQLLLDSLCNYVDHPERAGIWNAQTSAAADKVLALKQRAETAEKERDKLQAFKDYVHQRLDAAGVPADPPSSHREAGCRIGGRLDLVLASAKAEAELALREARIRLALLYLMPGSVNPQFANHALRGLFDHAANREAQPAPDGGTPTVTVEPAGQGDARG